MDVGATFCRPTAPRCVDCPARDECRYAATAGAAEHVSARGHARRAAAEPPQPFPATSRWLRGRILDRLRDGRGWVELESPDRLARSRRDRSGARRSRRGGSRRAPTGPRSSAPACRSRTPSRRGRLEAMAASTIRPAPSAASDSLAEPPLPARRPDAVRARPARAPRSLGADRRAPPMTAEAMVGADRRAQALGVPGIELMEQAGTATAAAARALAIDTERWGRGPVVILAGPGNNGGDGFVAARHLARAGADVIVAFVAGRVPADGARTRPGTGTASSASRASSSSTPRSLATSRSSARASTRPRSSSTRCSGPASGARFASRSGARSSSSTGPARRWSRSSPSTRRPRSTSRAASRPIRRSGPTSRSRSTGPRPDCARRWERRSPAGCSSPRSGSRPRPTVADRPVGLRDVLVLAGACVVVVLGAAILTSFLPADAPGRGLPDAAADRRAHRRDGRSAVADRPAPPRRRTGRRPRARAAGTAVGVTGRPPPTPGGGRSPRCRTALSTCVVIGGGIVGCGALLDATSRGPDGRRSSSEMTSRSGTSSRSSRLIHGGLRYLEQYRFGLVREALAERARIVRLAPHLVRVEPFLFPAVRQTGRRPVASTSRA